MPPQSDFATLTSSDPVSPGQILSGSIFNEAVRVETVQASGPASWVAGVVGMQSERFRRVTLTVAGTMIMAAPR